MAIGKAGGEGMSIITRFTHNVLEWHKPKPGTEHFHPNDPLKFLVFAECKYCGKQIRCDSQGNWY